MTPILNWFLTTWLAAVIFVIAVALLAYCVWDGWGRYRKMHRDLEEWRRGQ